jgi:CheY-like chemotaxis protein
MCLQQSVGAHEVLKAQHTVAIILDIQMETAEARLDMVTLLRRDPATAQIPVILCSARTVLLAARAEYLQAQRCVILKKPFQLDKLVRLVATLAPLSRCFEVRAGSSRRYCTPCPHTDHSRSAGPMKICRYSSTCMGENGLGIKP